MNTTDESHPSSGAVQQEIQGEMLELVDRENPNWTRINWRNAISELGLTGVWSDAEPDGAWLTEEGGVIVGECYARVGKLLEGHRRKLAKDALKLWAIKEASRNVSRIERMLLIIPTELAAQLQGGWFPEALGKAATFCPVELNDNQRLRLEDASRKQAQGQARTKRQT